MSQRAALVAGTSLLAVGGVLWAGDSGPAHAGAHFVDGHASPQAVHVELGGGHGCRVSKDGVAVPVHVRLSRDAGATGMVTVHVIATVSYRIAGDARVASAAQDIPVRSTNYMWVPVPLDRPQTRSEIGDCGVTWTTVTPGAWVSDD